MVLAIETEYKRYVPVCNKPYCVKTDIDQINWVSGDTGKWAGIRTGNRTSNQTSKQTGM